MSPVRQVATRALRLVRDARHGKRPTTSRLDFVNPQCGRVHTLWSLQRLRSSRVRRHGEPSSGVHESAPGCRGLSGGNLVGGRTARLAARCRRVLPGVGPRRPRRRRGDGLDRPRHPAPARSATCRWRSPRRPPTGPPRRRCRWPGTRPAAAAPRTPMPSDRGAVDRAGLSVVPDLPATGGRRTADETAQFASVGRRRAPETGRDRRWPAVGAPRDRRGAGRRSSPGARGRRRRDAGRCGRPPPRPRRPRPSRLGRHRARRGAEPRDRRGREKAARRPGRCPRAPEADLLTRPMRLTDQPAQSRRPRLGGSLGV